MGRWVGGSSEVAGVRAGAGVTVRLLDLSYLFIDLIMAQVKYMQGAK